MIRLFREICLCLAVAALLLIGGAVVLLWTKAVEGFEVMSGEISLKRQQFGEVFRR